MEREQQQDRHRRCLVPLLSFALVSLGAVSFISCIAAEVNRSKIEEMKLDGKLCYLPRSGALKYGIAALACLAGAQAIGCIVICGSFCSLETRRGISNAIKILLFVLSWISFGGVAMLLGTATSMNREQPYGEGWLDGECYLVKKPVYDASAVLILFSVASMLSAAIVAASGLLSKRKQQRIHRRGG
ncbi:hypothetical protein MLD38_021319 [Melastoma candidum]|uniref:Uncharacterized protein n=1 Tax=Melastoma candidum TaxID=119954 RepID=A0ACB9QFW6_9MYRT|nr:hypothetical protein MLD38_021319 [Melastoma candidum]